MCTRARVPCSRACGACRSHRTGSEEKGELILRKLNEEAARLHELIAVEKRVREETELQMVKMLEDMCARMQADIQARTAACPVLSVLCPLSLVRGVRLTARGRR